MKLLADLTIPGYNIKAPNGVPTGGIENGPFETILQNSLMVFILFVLIVATIMILFSGIQWIVSGGDKNKIEAARNRLIFSIVGLVIALLAFFIVQLIGGIFGVENSLVR